MCRVVGAGWLTSDVRSHSAGLGRGSHRSTIVRAFPHGRPLDACRARWVLAILLTTAAAGASYEATAAEPSNGGRASRRVSTLHGGDVADSTRRTRRGSASRAVAQDGGLPGLPRARVQALSNRILEFHEAEDLRNSRDEHGAGRNSPSGSPPKRRQLW